MEGTNTGQENAAGMASVGVRLTAELGHGGCAKRPCPSSVMALPLPERWRAPMGGQLCTSAPRCSIVWRCLSSVANAFSITWAGSSWQVAQQPRRPGTYQGALSVHLGQLSAVCLFAR